MSMTQEEIDALINSGKLEEEAETTEEKTAAAPEADAEKGSEKKPETPEIDFAQSGDTIYSPLDPKMELLYDIQLPISIELGRTNMLVRDILRLGRGSVIEFDKLVSEPVDILINGKKIAEGEVVVIDKHFGIRITTLVDPTDRIRALKK